MPPWEFNVPVWRFAVRAYRYIVRAYGYIVRAYGYIVRAYGYIVRFVPSVLVYVYLALAARDAPVVTTLVALSPLLFAPCTLVGRPMRATFTVGTPPHPFVTAIAAFGLTLPCLIPPCVAVLAAHACVSHDGAPAPWYIRGFLVIQLVCFGALGAFGTCARFSLVLAAEYVDVRKTDAWRVIGCALDATIVMALAATVKTPPTLQAWLPHDAIATATIVVATAAVCANVLVGVWVRGHGPTIPELIFEYAVIPVILAWTAGLAVGIAANGSVFGFDMGAVARTGMAAIMFVLAGLRVSVNYPKTAGAFDAVGKCAPVAARTLPPVVTAVILAAPAIRVLFRRKFVPCYSATYELTAAPLMEPCHDVWRASVVFMLAPIVVWLLRNHS